MIPELLEDWHETAGSAPFWAAARHGRLVVQRCACGAWQHPPRPFCLACGSTPDFAPVSGRGTVYSFTVVERALVPALRPFVPYVLALIDLEEGVRMLSVLRGEPAIG